MKISETIRDCIPFITESWKESYRDFLVEEHIETFSKRMELYMDNKTPPKYTLPVFEEEVTPPVEVAYGSFDDAIRTTKMCKSLEDEKKISKLWAATLENTPFEYLLLIIGQRYTPASIKNQAAIPPIKKVLIESCFIPINSQIVMATRAWEKHIGRSTDNFWGQIKGNSKEKEERVKRLVMYMIECHTWWNMFYHYKHELVYEIRVPSGHGIRWTSDGTKLIGFLEPFV
ncbi:hypothetical protein [Aquimarina sediminis]|uniref:hypothetical protein n=1 Tax=Aquimarina sediminis TaxID=2070536 RepID=UPI000FFF5EA4|nr:hypothetical protein [Aquimarina sediminis]